MLLPPTTLNGYPVIAVIPVVPILMQRARELLIPVPDTSVVLVHRQDNEHQPFVTARWSPSCGDSWDQGTYLATLGEGLASLVERAGIDKPKHDSGAAPPLGFTRYQIEIVVPDDEDPSALLERAQTLAAEILDEHEIAYDDGDIGAPIVNATSVQMMVG